MTSSAPARGRILVVDDDRAIRHAMSTLLENRPREEVATRVDISGRIDKPDVRPVVAAARLFQNAFIKAILPGFERRGRER